MPAADDLKNLVHNGKEWLDENPELEKWGGMAVGAIASWKIIQSITGSLGMNGGIMGLFATGLALFGGYEGATHFSDYLTGSEVRPDHNSRTSAAQLDRSSTTAVPTKDFAQATGAGNANTNPASQPAPNRELVLQSDGSWAPPVSPTQPESQSYGGMTPAPAF